MPWVDSTTEWLNELGLDAFVLQMPGYQCNFHQPGAGWAPANGSHGPIGGGCHHAWWSEIEAQVSELPKSRQRCE